MAQKGLREAKLNQLPTLGKRVELWLWPKLNLSHVLVATIHLNKKFWYFCSSLFCEFFSCKGQVFWYCRISNKVIHLLHYHCSNIEQSMPQFSG